MSKLRPALSAAAILAACAAGCGDRSASGGTGQQDGKTPAALELVPMPHPRLWDLPVPIGFALDEGRSRNFQAAGARYVDHVYTGSADRFAVGRFYKRYMPVSRWVLVTDMFVQGSITVDFEKETERCRIAISKGSLFSPTHIKVAIWTTGRIAPVPDKGGGSR